MNGLYFDSASTTPVDVEVAAAMLQVLHTVSGNPSSSAHAFGRSAAQRVEQGRRQIAEEFGCESDEVIFTSGATEADNLALAGVAHAHADKGRHLIVSAIEHRAVLACAEQLERDGFAVTRVKPDANGVVAPAAIAAAIRPDTLLISLMHTNNEIGVIQPIEAVAELAAEAGVLFHVDAAQAVGKFEIDLAALPIDLLTASAHKLHGPQGIGCLILRNRRLLKLAPLMQGGAHEYGLRPGTLPVHQIVGFAAALRKAARQRAHDLAQVTAVRARFLDTLSAQADTDVIVQGAAAPQRSPYILGLSFPGLSSDALINQLDGQVAIASGSACSSGALEPSYVLRAMGVQDDLLYGAVRVSFDRTHSIEQADEAARRIAAAVRRIRRLMQESG